MSPAPQVDTVAYPAKLPLVVKTSNRDGDFHKDARLVNCYIETEEDQLWVRKRPGTLFASQVATSGSYGRGIFFWRGDSYTIFNGTLFRNGSSIVSGLDATNGVYRFNSILGAIPKMVFGNGVKTYSYTVAGGVTSDLHTLDADFPTTCVKGIVYLNGATYVMNSAAEVWGSTINDVGAGAWSAVNFIAAQMEADAGVALAKQLVYAVAFGEWSTEVFYDAGNPTGSPLGNVQGSKISYGCASADSVQRIDDQLFWLSSNETAYTQISMMDKLNHRVISTPAIDRLLRDANLTTVYSLQLKLDGHSFYVLTIKEENLTIVYDVSEDLWSQWTDADGNYFPYVAASYDSSRRLLIQHETNGRIYYVNSSYYSDDNRVITADIYTPNFNANTMRRKTMKVMRFDGDQTKGSVLQVRKSDDDYQTWSNFRKVPLDNRQPTLPDGGTFVRRAYHFRHQQNTPLRLQAVDVQYDIGTL